MPIALLTGLLLTALLAACSGPGSSSQPAPMQPTASIELIAGTSNGPPVPNTGSPCCRMDGHGLEARFGQADEIFQDTAGNLFIIDGLSAIRKVTPAQDVTTLPAAFAGFIRGITGDGTNLYVGQYSQCIAGSTRPACSGFSGVLKIAPDNTVSPVTGSNFPGAITRDDSGTLWWTTGNVVVKLPANGAYTVVGASPGPGDDLYGIAIDRAGNALVSARAAHVVYKVSPAGEFTVLAGLPGQAGDADGAGSAARFNNPSGMRMDAQGNLYVADTSNNLIRKISPSGLVTTVAGTRGQQGLVNGPLPGLLAYPQDVQLSGDDLYVALWQGIALIHHRP